MPIVYMKDIRKLYSEQLDLQEELNDAIESFIENPIRTNKNKVNEISVEYKKLRAKLMKKICDFWCKGE